MKRNKPALITGHIALRAPRCPTCAAEVAVQATVDEFGQPAAWHFWGFEGARWVKCRGEQNGVEFVHFVTLVNGVYSHRLAWINRRPAPATEEQIKLL